MSANLNPDDVEYELAQEPVATHTYWHDNQNGVLIGTFHEGAKEDCPTCSEAS